MILRTTKKYYAGKVASPEVNAWVCSETFLRTSPDLAALLLATARNSAFVQLRYLGGAARRPIYISTEMARSLTLAPRLRIFRFQQLIEELSEPRIMSSLGAIFYNPLVQAPILASCVYPGPPIKREQM